jgi:tetratricopeptide (TPR) repeat protein
MRLRILYIFLVLMITGLSPVAAQDVTDCRITDQPRNSDQALIIAACSAILDKGNPNREMRALAHQARAIAQHGLRNYDAALADFGRAIEAKANDATLFHDRGNTHRAKGDHRAAVADYDRAILLNPNYGLAYFGRGDSLAALGDRQRAIGDLEKVLALPASTRREQRAVQLSVQKLIQLGAMRPGRRVALVIGNSRYVGQSALTNPANDAKAVAAKLKATGFQEVIEAYDLDQRGMVDALKTFGDKASEADWAMIFYAGHGIEVGGINYLIPTDARLQRDTHIQDEAISLERVLAKVQGAKQVRLVVLDACRNNPFATRMVRSTGATRSVGAGLANIEPEAGVLVLYSAKHGSLALDGEGANSPFTEAFIAHLDEPAIDLVTLAGKVRQSVLRKTQNGQEPWMYGAPSSERHFFKMN